MIYRQEWCGCWTGSSGEAGDKAGIALHLVDMGGTSMNTASAMGRMFLTLMAGCAELERNLVAERSASVLAHKKQQGNRL